MIWYLMFFNYLLNNYKWSVSYSSSNIPSVTKYVYVNISTMLIQVVHIWISYFLSNGYYHLDSISNISKKAYERRESEEIGKSELWIDRPCLHLWWGLFKLSILTTLVYLTLNATVWFDLSTFSYIFLAIL